MGCVFSGFRGHLSFLARRPPTRCLVAHPSVLEEHEGVVPEASHALLPPGAPEISMRFAVSSKKRNPKMSGVFQRWRW